MFPKFLHNVGLGCGEPGGKLIGGGFLVEGGLTVIVEDREDDEAGLPFVLAENDLEEAAWSHSDRLEHLFSLLKKIRCLWILVDTRLRYHDEVKTQ